jgi:hypothetical protein
MFFNDPSTCLLTWRGFFRDTLLIFRGAKSRGRERSDPPRRGALGGRGDAVAVCQREPTHAPTPRNRMATALDPRRRRAGLHQHRVQPSPPKPQTRMAAGPASRAAESQISYDSICVVDGAVESLEPNPPLYTMLCYRRAKPTVEKALADLDPARSGMRPRG